MTNKKALRQMLEEVMRPQFRVWAGTENAYEVLEDTCNALSHHLLKLDSDGRAAFLVNCKDWERDYCSEAHDNKGKSHSHKEGDRAIVNGMPVVFRNARWIRI